MNRLTVDKAITELNTGNMIILTDDADRENEGDIILFADRASLEQVDFITRYARGLTCVAISEEKAKALQLPLMVADNSSLHETAFTVSVDAAAGGTGISVRDRTLAINILGNPETRPEELARPGHMFPLIGKPGGLLERDGHTEGALELARLAGAEPAVVICEVHGEGFDMAVGEEMESFAQEHGLGILSMEDLKIAVTAPTVTTELETIHGTFDMSCYPPDYDSEEPVIVLAGKQFDPTGEVDVRIHSECITGDLFGSNHCDCGSQLEQALSMIAKTNGLLIYLRQEGRGIGLEEKIKAYALQAEGFDTWDANTELGHEPDERDYSYATRILKSLSVERVRLLTNNPDKIRTVREAGIEISPIALEIEPTDRSFAYLTTKKERFGHTILQGA